MTDVDIAKLLRLQGAVDAVLRGSGGGTNTGLAGSYMAIRGQVLEAVPEGLKAELDAICPEVARSGRSVLEMKVASDKAESALKTMSGWLSALIQLK